MTSQQYIEKRNASIDAMCGIVREWQRGAISQQQMTWSLGRDYLTQEQIDALVRRVYRTIDRAELARVIAEVTA